MVSIEITEYKENLPDRFYLECYAALSKFLGQDERLEWLGISYRRANVCP